jgi:excisionase family DNA binding protein
MKEITQIVVTNPDLFNITDAAKELGVSRMTIYRWMASNKLRAIKFGGVWFIPSSEVDKLRADVVGEEVGVAQVAPTGVDDAKSTN